MYLLVIPTEFIGNRVGETGKRIIFVFFYTSHGSKNMFTAWSSAPRRVQGTYTHLCRRMRGCWATTMRLLCTLDIIQIYYSREPCAFVELFSNRGRMTTWLNIIIIIMRIISHWKNYWVVAVVGKCISAGSLERNYSIVPG